MIMDKTLDLAALRAFRAVVLARSFSGAAKALRIPKSTLSKRVADLEADLGIRLIERTTRAMHITPEGEVLSARSEGLLGEADDIRRALTESGGMARGHLRIAVPQLIGNLYWGRIAAGFRASYPDITLECHFLDRAPDLLQEGFDGAIRFGPIEEGGLIARVVRESHGIVVAQPHLPGIDAVEEPVDLLALPLVGYAVPWPGGWTLIDGQSRIVEVLATPELRLGSPLAVRDAVLAGAGAAVLPALIAIPEIGAGRLMRLLPDWSTARKPLLFVYPSAQSMTARLRALIDWTTQAMKDLEKARSAI
jgi:DNA-binding transcriptional LysR family regulator